MGVPPTQVMDDHGLKAMAAMVTTGDPPWRLSQGGPGKSALKQRNMAEALSMFLSSILDIENWNHTFDI